MVDASLPTPPTCIRAHTLAHTVAHTINPMNAAPPAGDTTMVPPPTFTPRLTPFALALLALPPELLTHILLYLAPDDLGILSRIVGPLEGVERDSYLWAVWVHHVSCFWGLRMESFLACIGTAFPQPAANDGSLKLTADGALACPPRPLLFPPAGPTRTRAPGYAARRGDHQRRPRGRVLGQPFCECFSASRKHGPSAPPTPPPP